ncbi:MAG TPA: bifunctional DNA primase/polymerase [Solirubrobacteraceae bacterium]
MPGHGWSLLPIKPGTKKPHCAVLVTVHGSAQWGSLALRPASTPEIVAWFESDPNTGIGIITGNGLAIADFDRPCPDVRYPATPTSRTSRGYHVYFAAEGRAPGSKHPWGELKGDGGYVVAPPSQHPNGGRYEWLIGPDDAPLAPLSSLSGVDLRLPSVPPASLQGRARGRTYDRPLAPTTADRGTGDELAKAEEAVVAALPGLGITGRLGSPFRCVLPGHHDEHPSASLFRDPRTGVWKYHDWHRASQSGREWWTLAEVFASQVARREVRLNPPSASRWYRRLFWQAGLIDIPAPASPPLPSSAPRVLRCVAEGFALLLVLRDVRDPGEPSPYSRAFAADWCGVREKQARVAIAELRRLDVLLIADVYRRGGVVTPLYEMGPGPATRRRATTSRRALGAGAS